MFLSVAWETAVAASPGNSFSDAPAPVFLNEELWAAAMAVHEALSGWCQAIEVWQP